MEYDKNFKTREARLHTRLFRHYKMLLDLTNIDEVSETPNFTHIALKHHRQYFSELKNLTNGSYHEKYTHK